MANNIVLTTAENVVAVVDSVLACPANCTKEFVKEFADLSENQLDNALHMAEEFALIKYDEELQKYSINSFISRLLVTTSDANVKASIFRLILENYEPYITFKSRFLITQSVDRASEQVKIIYSMDSNKNDIKSTIISIATYSRSMIDLGANLYKLTTEDLTNPDILSNAIGTQVSCDDSLLYILGAPAYDFIDKTTVFKPLSNAYNKSKEENPDTKSIVLYAGNAFESFLAQFAETKEISLVGKSGIYSKARELSLSKKHMGMISFLSQIRNAADHGADPNENNKVWTISESTAKLYPLIVGHIIKIICDRDSGKMIV